MKRYRTIIDTIDIVPQEQQSGDTSNKLPLVTTNMKGVGVSVSSKEPEEDKMYTEEVKTIKDGNFMSDVVDQGSQLLPPPNRYPKDDPPPGAAWTLVDGRSCHQTFQMYHDFDEILYVERILTDDEQERSINCRVLKRGGQLHRNQIKGPEKHDLFTRLITSGTKKREPLIPSNESQKP